MGSPPPQLMINNEYLQVCGEEHQSLFAAWRSVPELASLRLLADVSPAQHIQPH